MAEHTNIIDGHCHVASTRYIPEAFLKDVAANIHKRFQAFGQPVSREKVCEMVIAQNQDHNADELVEEMDAAGITETVLLVPVFNHVMKCQLTPDVMALEHHHIRLRHPGRFRVFMGADPRSGQEGVVQFEKSITEYGFDGLKLYPPCGYSPSDRRLYPYYEICASLGLPVLLHTGPTAQSLQFEPAMPRNIEQAAKDFPGVNFILAHGGVSYVRESVDLALYKQNVYIDIGGFTGAIHPLGWQRHLLELLNMGCNHKIIFGTDWPIFRMSGGLSKLLKQFLSDGGVLSDLKDREKHLIMSGNIQGILPPKRDTRSNERTSQTAELT